VAQPLVLMSFGTVWALLVVVVLALAQ